MIIPSTTGPQTTSGQLLVVLAIALLFFLALSRAELRAMRLSAHGILSALAQSIRRRPLRLAISLALGFVVLVGASKPTGQESSRVAQFITAMRDGCVVDESGVVAKFTESETVRFFNQESGIIIAASSNQLYVATTNIAALVNTLTGTPRRVAYICADLPRADPASHTNHNIAAMVQRVDTTGGVERVWVWFSETPYAAPNISFDASVADGSWVTLAAVTNTFPETETVAGVPCIRYDFRVPAGMQGVPLRPSYELAFGGYATNQFLNVPSGGVMLSTNGVDILPFTGWETRWPAPWGTNLAIRYAGSIAMEVRWCGTNITGEVAL